MPIVDTHCHVSPIWYEPVETLLYEMDRCGVEYAVLVQMLGQTDNSYQFECVRRHPDRLASVVLVDSEHPNAGDVLALLVEQGAVGVRLRATTRSPGDDPLAIWRQAEALGLPISVAGDAASLSSPEFAQVAAAIPGVPIILEHLGSVNHPDGEAAPYPLRRQVFALAQHPHLYIKIHGLGEICPRQMPPASPIPLDVTNLALLDLAYAAFGPRRMMWGSDFPPVAGREGYANALAWPQTHFSAEDNAWIFGGTAMELYGLA